ncbi:MAG: GDSL-type esterase/lipase family protein [Corynebacterium sp.]|nr:GDSL-type esterase/lipase family protein [Corynebacterium sp.]
MEIHTRQFPKRVGSVVTAALLVFGLGTQAIPNASAQTANIVALGDSLSANPNNLELAAANNPELREQLNIPPTAPGKCVNGADNFPIRLGQQLGLPVENYACAGGTVEVAPVMGTNLEFQTTNAIEQGALNADTRVVTMTFGYNDFYQDPDREKPVEQRKAEASAAMEAQVQRIRAAAPNARIIMAGYPDLTDGQNNICPTNVLGLTSHIYSPFFTFAQNEIQDWQRTITSQLGITYLDMKEEINVANNNNGCSNNPERYSAALIDSAEHQLWGHLTANGNQYYADRIQSVL